MGNVEEIVENGKAKKREMQNANGKTLKKDRRP